MAEITMTELATEVRAKLDTITDSQVTDEKIDAKIAEALGNLEPSDDLVRKIRFSGGDQRLAGSKFGRLGMGVGDIEHLMMLTEAGKRAGKGPGPSEELRKAFDDVTEGVMLDAVSAEQADIHSVEAAYERGELDSHGYQRALASVRAMDTAESGFGSQLIGAQYVGSLWAAAKTESRVFDLFPTFDMTAPTAYLPVAAAPPVMSFVSESTSPTIGEGYTSTKSGSNRVTVTAKKFLIRQIWSGEMVEDSIIPFLPFLSEQAQRSISEYSDRLLLNGDDTNAGSGNINLNDADPGDTLYYLAFDGLRHACLIDNTSNKTSHSNASITWNALVDMRKLMADFTYFNDWGHPSNPADLVYFADPATVDEMAKLDEVITVDKYGSQATVLTGEVGNIGRHPVVSTIGLARLESDGLGINSPSDDRGSVLAVNTTGFNVGIRRQLQVKVGEFIESDQFQIVYSLRMGFGRFSPTGSDSGIEAASLLYNVA